MEVVDRTIVNVEMSSGEAKDIMAVLNIFINTYLEGGRSEDDLHLKKAVELYEKIKNVFDAKQ